MGSQAEGLAGEVVQPNGSPKGNVTWLEEGDPQMLQK